MFSNCLVFYDRSAEEVEFKVNLVKVETLSTRRDPSGGKTRS